eukprot:541245-Prymnesium_polylepis.1
MKLDRKWPTRSAKVPTRGAKGNKNSVKLRNRGAWNVQNRQQRFGVDCGILPHSSTWAAYSEDHNDGFESGQTFRLDQGSQVDQSLPKFVRVINLKLYLFVRGSRDVERVHWGDDCELPNRATAKNGKYGHQGSQFGNLPN